MFEPIKKIKIRKKDLAVYTIRLTFNLIFEC